MSSHLPFPDAEAFVATAIRDATSVGVYSSLPNDPTYPLVLVLRYGGLPVERHAVDGAELQVETWAESKSAARDLADAARVAVHELEGTAVTDPVNAFVTRVDDVLGLSWQPDAASKKDRYLFGLRVAAVTMT